MDVITYPRWKLKFIHIGKGWDWVTLLAREQSHDSFYAIGIILKNISKHIIKISLIAIFMGPTWGQSGADRTHVGSVLVPWTLLSGVSTTNGNNKRCSYLTSCTINSSKHIAHILLLLPNILQSNIDMIAPSNLLDRNPIDLILYPNISYEIYRYITENLLTNTSKIKHCVHLVYLDQYIHMSYGEHISTSYRINTMQNTKLTR